MIRRAPLLLLLAASPCPADEQPSFALTTDTPAYCAQLARQVSDPSLRAGGHSQVMEVQRLLAEGRDLCDRGQIRGGIRRLRRALVLLHYKPVKDDP